MAEDPWDWSPTQVKHFFRNNAEHYLQDRPQWSLPNTDSFLRVLESECVDGIMLLEHVGTIELKEDLGVKNMRERTAVLHCIAKLRKKSQGYLRSQAQKQIQDSLSGMETPVSVQTVVTLDVPLHSELSTTKGPVGENIRPGEQQVHDVKGNKRRRLNPVVLSDASVSSKSTKFNLPNVSNDWFSKVARPVDEMFYGVSDFGQVIGGSRLPDEILPNPIIDHEGMERTHDLKNQEDNFQFYHAKRNSGNSEFVSSRMQFFLQHATIDGKSVIELDRQDQHGRDRAAIAILPYREGLQAFARDFRRSATVFQLDSHRRAIATREDAVLLHTDYTDVAPVEGSGNDIGQWDFLLEKYPLSNNEELPLWRESDSEYSGGSSFDRELADEDATEVSGDDIHLSKTHASAVIDTMISEVAARWSEKRIPALEESQAWTVWKRMKGSKSQKQKLIASAESIIVKLNLRLSKLKDEILLDQWDDDATLRKQCKVLEVSIEDREEQRWMISVWQRKQEPAHVSHPKTSGTYQRALTTSTMMPSATIPVQDKLSMSPTPATRIDVRPNSGKESEDDHTAHESLEIDQGVIHEDQDLENMFIDDTNDQSSDGLPDNTVRESANVSDPDSAEKRSSGMKGDPNSNSPDDGDYVSCDDDLPSPQHFVPEKILQGPDEKIQVSKTLNQNNGYDEPTVISSDESSASPDHGCVAVRDKPAFQPKVEIQQKRKPIVFTGNPIDADCEEVDAWTFPHLERVQDRGRLLIKLLRNMDAAFRSRLRDFCVNRSSTKNSELDICLRKALEGIRTGSILNSAQDISCMLEVLARLFLAWHECDHAIMDRNAQDINWKHFGSTVDHQIAMFTRPLRSYLNMGQSKLFVSPKPNNSDAPISIDSSDENDAVRTTPHKKRKRRVKADASAETTRKTAQERLERFQSLVPARSSNPDGLEHMTSIDTAHSHININPAKNDEQDFININARIAAKMKNHQIDGVRFMWREITASDGDNSQGCILAHTMGLGKTMQTIALLAAVFEASNSHKQAILSQLPKHLRCKTRRDAGHLRGLVLCPPTLLQNWSREIELWAPRIFQVYSIHSGTRVKDGPLAELEHWHRNGGIMLLGYTTFRIMIQRKTGDWSRLSESEKKSVDDMLLNGTDLVVADEAHTFKNRNTAIGECVMRFHTRSRIALTGTPMSNHVGEVYSMMNWIAPGYLGEINEFNAHYREPIEEGQYLDSSSLEIRKSIKRLAVLRHEIEPKVHRADITVLKGLLSKKVEFMITVALTPAQTESYRRFVAALLGNGQDDEKVSQVTMFGWLEALTLLGNHPLPFRRKLLDPARSRVANSEQQEDSATPVNEMDDQIPLSAKPDNQAGVTNGESAAIDVDLRVLGLPDAKVQHILEPLADSIDPTLSVKTSLFVEILKHARLAGDKVLVFSLKLRTLEYLSELLISLGIKFGRIEGKIKLSDRIALLEEFHASNSTLEVLLISTRAGGVGWNITGANRVVIFDFGFNPSDEAQAIGRAYRLGQTKPVYVYRFVGGGTFEMDMHNKQLFKTGLAQRVVDKKNPRRNAMRNTRDYLYDPKYVPQEDLGEWLGKDPHVLDKVITSDTADGKQPRIRAIKTTETLEQDAMDAPLNELERKEVDEEIKMGKDRIRKLGKKTVTEMPMLRSQVGNVPPPSTAPSYRSTLPSSSRVNNAFPQTQPGSHQANSQPPIPPLKLKNPHSSQAKFDGLSDTQARQFPSPGPNHPGASQ